MSASPQPPHSAPGTLPATPRPSDGTLSVRKPYGGFQSDPELITPQMAREALHVWDPAQIISCLRHGLKPQQMRTVHGADALSMAIYHRAHSIIEELIAHGALQDPKGSFYLIHHLRSNSLAFPDETDLSLKILHTLLSGGCDPNAEDTVSGERPIMHALRHQLARHAVALARAGARLDTPLALPASSEGAPGPRELTCLDFALRCGPFSRAYLLTSLPELARQRPRAQHTPSARHQLGLARAWLAPSHA